MIHIDRAVVSPPQSLMGEKADERRRAAEAFFQVPESQRKQRRFEFSLQFAHPELRDLLVKVFLGKCAYCEQVIDFDIRTGYLDRFRPTFGAIGSDGKVAADHYWWLAYEWDNMLGACSSCNRAKGSRFPIEGRRASVGVKGAALESERALLLDPCRDQPEEHLLFSEDGHVSGLTPRGLATIEVCGLNRTPLVKLRAAEAALFRREDAEATGDASRAELTADHRQFAALRRHLLKSVKEGAPQQPAEAKARREQRQYDKRQQTYSLGKGSSVGAERARARYIDHVSLRNIGIHARLELPVASDRSSNAPWLVLLGENGVGKSTLLKAIAFALAGQAQWNGLGPEAMSILPLRDGVGTVHIRFTDGDSIKMSIDPATKQVSITFNEPRYRVLGFGATRLLPTTKHRPPEEPSYARLTNLFDPFCPLPDATAWLLGLPRRQFDRACAAIRALLDLPEEAVFQQRARGIVLAHGKHEQDIRNLSDGYQTVIGIACAIMAVLLQPDLPVEMAEGIVLIDEMGNHLHPTWRMRIVRSLKRAFPRVQFIATTHEPLCLRGLENDEIAVLRRTGPHSVALLEKLPPIQGLLVDQILSSPHFGLDSTVDPAFAEQLKEYYALLARPSRTGKEDARLSELEPEIRKLRQIGNTPSEQILLRTIDEHVARADKALAPIDPGALPADLQEQFLAVLESAIGTPGLASAGGGQP